MTKATDPKPATANEPAAPKAAPKLLHVLDTTAQPPTFDANNRVIAGPRTHEMPVDGFTKSFVFEHGKPLPLPPEVALKFLKHDAFKLTDEAGNIKPFRRRPKQPDELQAGEALVLKDDETVATYEELSSAALQARVLEMPGGEKFKSNPTRAALIEFIVAAKLTTRKLNTSKEIEVKPDEFVPTAEDLDDEAA